MEEDAVKLTWKRECKCLSYSSRQNLASKIQSSGSLSGGRRNVCDFKYVTVIDEGQKLEDSEEGSGVCAKQAEKVLVMSE